jgi:four helix bundle protein
MKHTDLEDRLVQLAVDVVKMTEGMPPSPAGRYYGGQVLRSSGSAALNYGEAQGGETHRDFTHKLKLVRKEVRESYLCMRVITGAGLHPKAELLSAISKEVSELLSIFTAAVKTAERRSQRKGSSEAP